jgi:hypothetical protein
MACLHLRMQTGDAAWYLPRLDAPAQEENRLSATRDVNGPGRPFHWRRRDSGKQGVDVFKSNRVGT